MFAFCSNEQGEAGRQARKNYPGKSGSPAVTVPKKNTMRMIMRMIARSLLWVVLSGLSLSACSMDRETLRTTAKAPGQPLRNELYGAIWDDLRSEITMIFEGGGWVSVLRGSGADGNLTVHIRDMRCRSSGRGRLCAFDLVRDSDPKRISDINEPKMLRCTASFRYEEGEWTVDRLPPKGGRHSRSTMECDEIAES